MNRESILTIASNVMRDIKLIQENVYRGELVIIESKYPAGICFLDLRDNVISWDGFYNYQEDLLAEDYYNTPGNQQWNYYLFLIQEKDKIDLETKAKIEKDDKYARKYVFDEKEFEDFFTLDAPTAEVTGNIVLEWKQQLEAVGLQDVYSNKSYVSAIEAFIHHRIEVEGTPALTPTTNVVQPKLNFINNLMLKEGYREYPKSRSFAFGKVNLFKGVNGVGKTSLFEAIELIACGKTFRNKDKRELDGCVEAHINGNLKVQEKYNPAETVKYRARDQYWYCNEYASGNHTIDSFNRFNFFNTDAANNFVNSHKETQVRESLTNLILGPEYTYVRERMEGFRDRIRPEYNKLKKEIDDANVRRNEATLIINRLKEKGSIKVFRDQIVDHLSKLKIHVEGLQIENEIPKVESIYNKLISLFDVFVSNQQPKIQSYAELSIRKSRLQEKINSWEEFVKEKDELQRRIQFQSVVIESLQTREQLFTKALKYFIDSRCFQLSGLSNRLQINKALIEKARSVHNIISELVLESYNKEFSYVHAKQENEQLLKISREQLLEVEHAIRDMLQRLDKVTQFITQIKSLGKEYFSLDQQAHICPLCETNFERDTLIEKINETLPNTSKGDYLIENLHYKQSELKNSIDLYNKTNNDFIALRTAYNLIGNELDENVKLSEIVSLVRSFLEQETSLLQEEGELNTLDMLIRSYSLSEIEFLSVSQQIQEIDDADLVFSFNNKAAFISAKEKSMQQIQEALITMGELTNERLVLSQGIKIKLELDEGKEYLPKDIQKQLDFEKNEINNYEETFHKIKELIRWDNDINVVEILQELSLFKRNIDSLKSELQNQTELRRAEDEKEKAIQFLNQNEGKANRIKRGYDLLVNLTSVTSINDLDVFFQQNLKEIDDIFRTIHAPREFNEILFEGGEMFLVHKSKEKRKVSQISTGQRAALAISVFISLHRKLKNGPKIVLFDDPISHIDDLNALSFIDFLRMFLLKDGDQIFIATASARLASLIEKKFEFLSYDFKSWELVR